MSCIPRKSLAIITTSLFGCLFAITGALASSTNDNNAKQELTKAVKANDINVQLGRHPFLLNQ